MLSCDVSNKIRSNLEDDSSLIDFFSQLDIDILINNKYIFEKSESIIEINPENSVKNITKSEISPEIKSETKSEIKSNKLSEKAEEIKKILSRNDNKIIAEIEYCNYDKDNIQKFGSDLWNLHIITFKEGNYYYYYYSWADYFKEPKNNYKLQMKDLVKNIYDNNYYSANIKKLTSDDIEYNKYFKELCNKPGPKEYKNILSRKVSEEADNCMSKIFKTQRIVCFDEEQSVSKENSEFDLSKLHIITSKKYNQYSYQIYYLKNKKYNDNNTKEEYILDETVDINKISENMNKESTLYKIEELSYCDEKFKKYFDILKKSIEV